MALKNNRLDIAEVKNSLIWSQLSSEDIIKVHQYLANEKKKEKKTQPENPKIMEAKVIIT
jgi:hypothetical protein